MMKKMLIACVLFFCVMICQPESYGQSLRHQNLSGKWKVTWNDGNHGTGSATWYMKQNPLNDTARYFEVDVPMDLNLAMKKKGLVSDLNFGSNFLSARWVAEQYWQYYKQFEIADGDLLQSAWLKFDRLDYNASVFLNGEPIAQHSNAYTPCVVDISGKLKKGKNILTVTIESGLYENVDKNASDYNRSIAAQLNKRHWLRKPQYQFSWDWNPFLINVGITGDVSILFGEKVRLDNIVPWVTMSDDLSAANLNIRSFIECSDGSGDYVVEAILVETGQKVDGTFSINKGTNLQELKMVVKQPELWWPVGQGSPKLYTLKVDIKKNGRLIDSGIRKIGFRKIEVYRAKHPDEGNYFTIKVNNRRVFLKGGNWVPADMIYSNVSTKKLDELTDLAIKANFNMLRIWGGGLYAGNELLNFCDEKGLLVWHDFLFACSKYPGDDPAFYQNVKKEITWAVREFAFHPSLAIWCGNNELEWGTYDWGYVDNGKVVPDYILYHHLIPNILKAEDPYRFFWPSSPYSENYESPNSPITGDQHPWGVTLGADTTNMWAYRDYVDRFPNEGGVMGASTLATLKQFLPENEQYPRSFSWDLHDNSMNYLTDKKGVSYKYIEDWIGKDYARMSLADYAFASGLLQAEGLSEYINNYHRRMYSSSSAIFWMYNDSWPATNGWSIVDYYHRKKLAYHPVRRAFAQQSVVIAAEGDKINVYGINETNAEWKGKLQYGIFETKGGYVTNNTKEVKLPANASTVIASFDQSTYEKAGYASHGAFAILKNNDVPISQYKMLMKKFKDMKLEKPQINIVRKGDYAILTSPVFVWGVCIDIDGEAPVTDNCFDLLPGIPYYVKLHNGETISVMQTGNDLMLKLNR